ncbi:hypothetical protein [Saliterribacillus persicus]|uniref:Uncharacterized protein n=1 Tax=Saliterribacillus persicus TaxID=930114 RepID=A0A368X6W7_9BACI|nr:hypothetical protein [Saliterribacillus persicus]RCW63740.1 hypothetical protein DFR57_11619 [Saliterribacillus persicus]
MVKVKMLVQSTYNKEILRKGKEYDIPLETAKRWEVSKIAIIIEEEINE